MSLTSYRAAPPRDPPLIYGLLKLSTSLESCAPTGLSPLCRHFLRVFWGHLRSVSIAAGSQIPVRRPRHFPKPPPAPPPRRGHAFENGQQLMPGVTAWPD